jgi:hypothetical protein
MPGQQLARFREQAARCGGTGVAGALYCSFRSRSITMRAVRLSRARDSLTESGSVRIESARSGSWVGSAAADCAKSSMLSASAQWRRCAQLAPPPASRRC